MNKLDRLAISAKIKAAMLKERLTNKEFGDSQVVVALVLIVVAVGLAIIFRNEVNTIISNVATRVSVVVNQLADGKIDSKNKIAY